jgi:hypothetical protein
MLTDGIAGSAADVNPVLAETTRADFWNIQEHTGSALLSALDVCLPTQPDETVSPKLKVIGVADLTRETASPGKAGIRNGNDGLTVNRGNGCGLRFRQSANVR